MKQLLFGIIAICCMLAAARGSVHGDSDHNHVEHSHVEHSHSDVEHSHVEHSHVEHSHVEHSHDHAHGSHELYHPPDKGRNDGITPLMSAILKNQINSAKALIADPNVDLNAQNEKGITALMFAIGKGMLDIVHLLVERGADISLLNIDGLSALQIAVGIEKLEMVDILIDAGADIVGLMKKYPKAKSVYRRLVSRDLLNDLTAECGLASRDSSQASAIVEYFLKHGLTKFSQVAYLEDDEVSKLPSGSAEANANLAECFKRVKASSSHEDTIVSNSRGEL